MKNSLSFLVGFLLGFLVFNEAYSSISCGIFTFLLYRIIFESNQQFVFREWALMLYCINYLLSPTITYYQPDGIVRYVMKIPLDEYFNLALPGFLLFALGIYSIRTKIFKVDYSYIDKSTLVNKKFLIRVVIFGLAMRIFSPMFPEEISYFIYLISMVRFVAAFALLSLSRRLWYYSITVLLFEIYNAFVSGMYHDAVMWIIFFSIFYVYTIKPKIRIKLMGVFGLVFFVLLIQAVKVSYREVAWQDKAKQNLETAGSITAEKANSTEIMEDNNLLTTLNRSNQAWIFASTVDNMNRANNFQGMTIVNKYLESALLPRFLAPNKLTSGNKEIFNEFSGHTINEGTSMGLGIFADGYIAYGALGVYIFGFILGLIFALTFKLVERWTKVSPFYVLLLLPLLNYAVRPDCELQTTINHLFKGILLFGFLVYLTRKRFTLDSAENQRKLNHLNLMK
jgi:hypothetical protein